MAIYEAKKAEPHKKLRLRPLWLPVPDVYRTFFMNLSEEIVDTIAAIQGFMAA